MSEKKRNFKGRFQGGEKEEFKHSGFKGEKEGGTVRGCPVLKEEVVLMGE